MTTTLTPRRIVSAVLAGVGGAAYYATPDFIASRTARGWTKAGISAVLVAASVPDMLELRDDRRTKAQEEKAQEQLTGAVAATDAVAAAGDVAAPDDANLQLSTRGKVAIGGIAITVIAASTAALVLAEKWVYRRGEARAAAGRSFAHTRPALVYGALAAAATLLPAPEG